MKTYFLTLFFLVLFNVSFSQEIGEISVRYDKTPEVFMTGIYDTLMWSGTVVIKFFDLITLRIEEVELQSYMIRTMDKEVICGNLLNINQNLCNVDYNLLYNDIEAKIYEMEFYATRDIISLNGNRVFFLFHFLILPKKEN